MPSHGGTLSGYQTPFLSMELDRSAYLSRPEPRPWWKNLWCNMFPESTSSPSELLPSRVSVPMPPVEYPKSNTPSQSSCFVLGILRSLQTERDQWEGTPTNQRYSEGWFPIPLVDVIHAKTDVRLLAFPKSRQMTKGLLDSCSYIAQVMVRSPRGDADQDLTLTKQEQVLIAQALEANPIDYLEAYIQTQAREAAREAAAKSHFERLGCPLSQ